MGASGEDSADTPGLFDTGAVYVFEQQGLDWVATQKLRAPVDIAFEEFGTSVGVALGDEGEDYIIVGAPGSGGTAYMFKRTGGAGMWEFEIGLQQLDPDERRSVWPRGRHRLFRAHKLGER